MKKTYQDPLTEIVGVVMESQVLTGSPAGPAGAPGVNAGRSGYTPGGGTPGGEEQTWN